MEDSDGKPTGKDKGPGGRVSTGNLTTAHNVVVAILERAGLDCDSLGVGVRTGPGPSEEGGISLLSINSTRLWSGYEFSLSHFAERTA